MPGTVRPGEEGSEPQHYVLERTGSPPVEFEGRLIAQGTTLSDKKDDRGYEIAIYEATQSSSGVPTGMRYIIHILYRTKWKSEADGAMVYGGHSGAEVAAKLLAYDPMYFVVGYPPGERFYEKRKRLEATLRGQYLSLASRLLTLVPGAAEPPE